MYESSNLSVNITLESIPNCICKQINLLRTSEAKQIPSNSYELAVLTRIDHMKRKIFKKTFMGNFKHYY